MPPKRRATKKFKVEKEFGSAWKNDSPTRTVQDITDESIHSGEDFEESEEEAEPTREARKTKAKPDAEANSPAAETKTSRLKRAERAVGHRRLVQVAANNTISST